ncbi:MAG: hypothetical protein WCR36_08220 [Bacteroidaceae bacterium]
MIKLVFITVLIVAISVLLISVKIIFVKGATFPNEHVGSSKGLQDRGIACAQTQDKIAQQKSHIAVREYKK